MKLSKGVMLRVYFSGLLAVCVLFSVRDAQGARIPSEVIVPSLQRITTAGFEDLTAECNDFYISSLEIFSMYARDISGSFKLEKGYILRFYDLHATFYGGEITGTVVITIGPPLTYRIELDFKSVDLEWFAMNLHDPETEFKGSLEGQLNISGNDQGDVSGTLDIHLMNGFLKKLPRWFTVFSLVNINPLGSNIISEGNVKLAISKDRFILKECVMETSGAFVYGKGEINFNGEADIILSPVGKYKFLSKVLPPLAFIKKSFDRGVMRVHIRGPFLSLDYSISPLYRLGASE